MNLLQGKRCLITGASRGIGRAIAVAYAEQGAILYLASRGVKALNEVAADCKKAGAQSVEVFELDASNEANVKSLANTLLSEKYQSYGVDVLVNNAGVLNTLNALNGDVDSVTHCLTVNVATPIILTRMLSPQMISRGEGSIVNIGSLAAVETWEGSGVYSASKFGLRGWSQGVFKTLKPHNVKVLLINPGYVNTEMVQIFKGVNFEKVIQTKDIAEVALLPFRCSIHACPEEVTVRVTGNPHEPIPVVN